jgi:hypothetical protein
MFSVPSLVVTASGSYHFELSAWSPQSAFSHAYLQILRYAIPQIHSLEVCVITIVEGPAIGIELVGELFRVNACRVWIREPTHHQILSLPGK